MTWTVATKQPSNKKRPPAFAAGSLASGMLAHREGEWRDYLLKPAAGKWAIGTLREKVEQ